MLLSFLFALGILVWVGINITFPSFAYSINKTDEFKKISVLLREFGEKKFVSLTPLYDYPYHRIRIQIDLEKGEKISQKEFPVFYGYEAEFYPVSSKKIQTTQDLENYLASENETDVLNGDLISGNGTVFFVSRGKARPFLDPEVFLRLGFDWGKVKKDEDGQLSLLGEGEDLSFISSHPDGVVLRFPDGKFFMVWEEELIEIGGLMAGQILDGGYFVDVKKQEKNPAGMCKVSRSGSQKAVCEIEGRGRFDASGQTYLLEFPAKQFFRIKEAKIKLSMLGNFDFEVAKESLKRVKDELSFRYKEDLLK